MAHDQNRPPQQAAPTASSRSTEHRRLEVPLQARMPRKEKSTDYTTKSQALPRRALKRAPSATKGASLSAHPSAVNVTTVPPSAVRMSTSTVTNDNSATPGLFLSPAAPVLREVVEIDDTTGDVRRVLEIDDDDEDDTNKKVPQERNEIIKIMSGRKFASEYPADYKKKMLRDVLAYDAATLVSDARVQDIAPAWIAYEQSKDKYERWTVRGITPFLHDIGKALFEEHEGNNSSLRLNRSGKTVLNFYTTCRKEIRAEAAKRKAAAEAKRAKGISSARSMTSLRNIPKGFRYRQEMVCFICRVFF